MAEGYARGEMLNLGNQEAQKEKLGKKIVPFRSHPQIVPPNTQEFGGNVLGLNINAWREIFFTWNNFNEEFLNSHDRFV